MDTPTLSSLYHDIWVTVLERLTRAAMGAEESPEELSGSPGPRDAEGTGVPRPTGEMRHNGIQRTP